MNNNNNNNNNNSNNNNNNNNVHILLRTNISHIELYDLLLQ